MKGYKPSQKPNFGWPQNVTWVNPSPNAPNLNMARVYPGSVILEGTTLSEGRGTTRSLEVVGAPDIDFKRILERMKKLGVKLWPSFNEIPQESSFYSETRNNLSKNQNVTVLIEIWSIFFDRVEQKPC